MSKGRSCSQIPGYGADPMQVEPKPAAKSRMHRRSGVQPMRIASSPGTSIYGLAYRKLILPMLYDTRVVAKVYEQQRLESFSADFEPLLPAFTTFFTTLLVGLIFDWLLSRHLDLLPTTMDISQFFELLSPPQKEALLQGPAMIPPPGVVPNFANPPNENALSWGIVVTGATLSTLAVFVRLYPLISTGKRPTLRLEDCQ